MLVGIYSDKSIRKYKGKNYPILGLFARAMNLLSLKYVDDVVFDAPPKIMPNFINENNIKEIVEGNKYYLSELKKDEFDFIDQSIVFFIESGSDF